MSIDGICFFCNHSQIEGKEVLVLKNRKHGKGSMRVVLLHLEPALSSRLFSTPSNISEEKNKKARNLHEIAMLRA